MNESFLQRWARRKAEHKNAEAQSKQDERVDAQATDSHSAGLMPEEATAPLPTLDDVARLTHDSDYSPFLSKSIDKSVRRAALKKLFSDPHFNVMDGLDIYIDDYNKTIPVSPAMLAALKHTQSLFDAIKIREAEQTEPKDDSDLEENGAGSDHHAITHERNAECAQVMNAGNEDRPGNAGQHGAQHPEHDDKDDGSQAAQGRI